MKKIFYFAVAALALSACTSDELVGVIETPEQEVEETPVAISFGGNTKGLTRADHVGADAAGLLDNNFVVEGVRGNGTLQTEVFDHFNVNYKASTANTTESNTSNWEYVGEDQIVKGVFASDGTTKDKLSQASAQTIKYWNYESTQYDFVAVSLGKGVGVAGSETYAKLSRINTGNIGNAVTSEPVYTLTGSADQLAAAYVADLVTVYNRDGVDEFGEKTIITPKFRSLGTKVRLAFYETVPGYSVNNVKFYNAAWDETTVTSVAGSDVPTLFAASAIFPDANAGTPTTGTMKVFYPTVGWDNSGNGTAAKDPDYNQAHVAFAADPVSGTDPTSTLVTKKTFGTALDYKTTKEDSEKDNTKYLGRTSSTATYAGDPAKNYYEIVLPLGSSDNLQLRVEYDLIPTDGSADVIHVRDARAVVPAAYAEWKPNYAYTYIFKITDATNGWTGTRPVPNPNFDPSLPVDPVTNPEYIDEVIEGLTPITFDAVVVDTTDGIQETVTTVAKPTITTYQEGVNASAISEYKPGTIYASVMNGTTDITLSTSNMAFYKATTNGTNDINEAIVQDMLDGKKSNTGITLTSMGYTIKTEVPAVDGNTYTVSAAELTVQGGNTYVFMYTDGSKNYVKVIKVASEGVAGVAYNWQAAANSYTYTAKVTAGVDNTTATPTPMVTFDYTGKTLSATKKEILDDLARYLGAVYYAGKATSIVWSSETYTWDPVNAGNLKGSNWYNTTEGTLVSVLNAWYAANPTATQITLTIEGKDTILKFIP